MRANGFIRSVLAVGLMLVTSFALSATCSTSTGYLVDPTGSMTPREAFQQSYKSFEGVLGNGYTDATVWVRLQVNACPGAVDDDSLIVRIRPTYIDEIALFEPARGGKYLDQPAGLTGDTTTLATASYKSINMGFKVPVSAETSVMFLRVRTHSSNTLKVEVMTAAEAQEAALDQAYLNACMLTLLALFLCWALAQLVLWRDAFSVVFAWQQWVVLLHGVFILGYARYFLSDTYGAHFVDLGTSVLVLSYIGSRMLLEFYLLLQIKPARAHLRWFYPVALGWLCGVMAFFFYSQRVGLLLNLLAGSVGITLCLVVSILTPSRKPSSGEVTLPKYVLTAYFFLIWLICVLFALPMFGIASTANWIIDLPTIIGVVSSSLVMGTLLVRRHYIEANAKALAISLQLVEERARFEQEKRAEQAHMLAVLIHEVKNPLAVAKLNLGLARESDRSHARLGRAIDNINEIVEQCGLSLQFEQALIKPSMRSCDVSRIMAEFLYELPYRQRIEINFAPSLQVRTDPRLLTIVVTNLLDNAHKYAVQDTAIQFGLSFSDRQPFILTVGNAILPGQEVDPEKMFSKFYRAPSTGSQSGSGLGLYICSNIASALEMSLSVDISENYIEFKLCSLN